MKNPCKRLCLAGTLQFIPVLLTGWLANANNAAAQSPTIVAGPTNQTVAVGGTFTLGVTTRGLAPAYQWFKDSRLIVGATNSTLTLTNAEVTSSGTYYVVVTNGSGMAISLPALVAVGNPTLLAWGWNVYGQLGDGAVTDTNPPVRIANNVVTGAAGHEHSLFVTSDGTLWAMGLDVFGQLGNGTNKPGPNPIPISVASNVVAVAAGSMHSLFVTTNGTLWAMGLNNTGQLGNGTTTNTNRPVNVASNVVAVAAGGNHSLFVKMDGTLWAMGDNSNGQLGNGTTAKALFPIKVASNVVAVAAGGWYSLFLKSDGTLWGMGANYDGQLGNGTSNNNYLLPISIASNVVAMAAGISHSLFVTKKGTLWATGDNEYGQLGDGTTNNVSIPVDVASNIVGVSSGAYHSLFVKNDLTLWAMGDNYYGQLGNGTTFDSTNLPVIAVRLSAANIFPANMAFHSLAIGINYITAGIGMTNHIPTLTFPGIPGKSYSVARSTGSTNWTILLTTNEPPFGVFQFRDTDAPQANAFYRLQPNP